ncbi:MAG TPA: hypothetical protein PKA03_10110 [Tabrizicola sp.]|nr:hypothetical protein [Tabrizicola sp.]
MKTKRIFLLTISSSFLLSSAVLSGGSAEMTYQAPELSSGPTLGNCQGALQNGKVLRVEADGTLWIADGNETIFIIAITENEMRCRMVIYRD